ncbi:hypothetical protein Pla22_41280 [Rubripirellula amarantea]|uniref:Uncharacterized protein n=1 Tax=Rubripirellula amarantea TaxID=2527999 RepID=A0A5C5WMN0_9BACT|nr:hypothetical protein Pla22_41280 [Rubripirellula amarantea]
MVGQSIFARLPPTASPIQASRNLAYILAPPTLDRQSQKLRK